MKKCTAALALAFVAMFAVGALAQSRPRRVTQGAPAPAARNDDSPGSADTPVELEGTLIEVPVVVSDRSGHYVPDLRKQDFELREDGQLQEISFFQSERVPIHVALLLDTSLSTRFSLGDIQEAAIDFINQLLPGDEIMIVSFAGTVTIEQEFTGDRRQLIDAVRRTHPTLGTRLYEALFRTVTERLRHVDGRKAIVILSDGQDVGSAVSFEQGVDVCAESDVVVYGIRYPRAADLKRDRAGGWLDPTPPRYRGGKNMRRQRFPGRPLASTAADPQIWRQRSRPRRPLDPFMDTVTANSGGTLYYAGAIADIRALFGKISEELRHVYVLGYAPSNPISNGGYRTVHVRISSKPDLAIRHRLGYQAGVHP